VEVDGGGQVVHAAIIAVCDAVAVASEVLESVRAGGLLRPSERVLALVSGGRDSVCLLDVLVTICGAPRVAVLHVDYGLRGAESDGDALAVARLCASLGVRAHVHRAPRPPATGNLQAWARDLRYARALELADGALIATGHTATDQAETVLYRLAASPGRRALLGIAAREGRLVRPLLSVTREQTAAHCRERGLGWRDDSSNGSERFARARVRHRVLAELRDVHPAAQANLLRTVEILRAEAAVLDEVVGTALAGRARISLEHLAALPPALARLVVIRLAEDAAGAAVEGVGGRVGELLALASRGGSAMLDVGGGTRAVVEYGVLRFERGASPEPPGQAALAVPGRASFGAWALRATLEDTVPTHAGERATFDAECLGGGTLTVRAWRAGDRMRPLGLGGSKSVADLFSDRRIPRAQRTTIPLVLRAEEIVWIPGVASAERCRVGVRTRSVVVISAARQ
jgi:tRNA(Ile)-lysidine synthase